MCAVELITRETTDEIRADVFIFVYITHENILLSVREGKPI